MVNKSTLCWYFYLVNFTSSAYFLMHMWLLLSRTSRPVKDENEPGILTEEDWKRLNDIIGYKECDEDQLLIQDKGRPYISLKLCMNHNASKLIDSEECLADLSCDNLESCIKLYPEAKIVDIKLGSYRLLSPNGLLAEVWWISDVFMSYLLSISANNLVYISTLQSESESDSLVALFCYKPPDGDIDWSLVAKASPCYATVRCQFWPIFIIFIRDFDMNVSLVQYLKESINQIMDFFESSATVSQALVQETTSAVQVCTVTFRALNSWFFTQLAVTLNLSD